MRVECPLEVSTQEPAAPVTKQDGVTDAERYLGRLGTRSFLSLWSYPGVYRNTGPAGGHGKEVCDLLVVFRDDIIIFSDKDCAFPDKGDLWVDWGRWYRKAILESANQVWGAERFIRTNPQRLFIDRACQRPFPIALPPQDQMRFHRVVVAHGTRKRCRAHLGGTGTLVLKPDIVGKAHYERDCEPFLIGDVDPTKGFVHVLDDISLDVVLGHLDTVADFIAYLTKKEAFYRSEKLALAGGEDDLLAYYLHDINDQEEHDFIYPAGTDAVVVEPGQWQLFSASQAYVRQQEANWVSGAWDALIEEFGKHILGGTSIASTHFNVEEQERAVRMLAAEGRTARRALGQSLSRSCGKRRRASAVRSVMGSPRPGSAHYVFVILPQGDMDETRYWQVRRQVLEAYCMVLKVLFPEALDLVGVATEPGEATARSQDVIYIDARDWTPEMQAQAEDLHAKGVLKNTRPIQRSTILEYPGSE